jgi:hypothetical protein
MLVLRRRSLPFRPEEILQQRLTFSLQHTARYLHMVVEAAKPIVRVVNALH